MRLRLNKHDDSSIFTLVVSGAIDESQAWDVLMVAQTMLGMARCRELVLDMRDAAVDEEVTVFNTDTLMSVFEEALCLKDRTVVICQPEDREIRICSDQLPLAAAPAYTDVSVEEAKFFGRALKWIEQEARFLPN
jgi:hypothetical protein